MTTCVLVDDLLVTGSCESLIVQTRNDLQLKFNMKDLGELTFFLGIEFARSKEGYVMNQRKYALELISEMGLSGAKPVHTPIDPNVRIDISFVVQVLSQYMHAPKESHMEAALQVVRYIKTAPGLGLFMPSQSSELLTTYCDSDWGTCMQTRKSVTGYLVKFGDAIISWKSK
uniref:Reverse transcriptase Ty1/copia-type domain-containing protein n=1 Tax=Solanum lycopersicum TaxID=4081 RepID=A0A3Q7I0F8_SOLLC